MLINGTQAVVQSAASNGQSLTVQVPPLGSSGPVTVQTAGGLATSSDQIYVVPPMAHIFGHAFSAADVPIATPMPTSSSGGSLSGALTVNLASNPGTSVILVTFTAAAGQRFAVQAVPNGVEALDCTTSVGLYDALSTMLIAPQSCWRTEIFTTVSTPSSGTATLVALVGGGRTGTMSFSVVDCGTACLVTSASDSLAWVPGTTRGVSWLGGFGNGSGSQGGPVGRTYAAWPSQVRVGLFAANDPDNATPRATSAALTATEDGSGSLTIPTSLSPGAYQMRLLDAATGGLLAVSNDVQVLPSATATPTSSPTITQTPTVTRTPTPTASPTPTALAGFAARLNAGGSSYTDGASRAWAADYAYTAGSTFSTSATISRTSDQALYQSGRYGNFSYYLALPNGSYQVVLKFAEPSRNSTWTRLRRGAPGHHGIEQLRRLRRGRTRPRTTRR